MADQMGPWQLPNDNTTSARRTLKPITLFTDKGLKINKSVRRKDSFHRTNCNKMPIF